LQEYNIIERTTVQSFDPRALEAMHSIDPQVSTSLIISNSHGIRENLAQLSFVPDIYSPDYKLVDEELIRAAHARNIQVVAFSCKRRGICPSCGARRSTDRTMSMPSLIEPCRLIQEAGLGILGGPVIVLYVPSPRPKT